MNNKLKSGDTGPDGRVFWRYHPNCKDGEHWVTPEQYHIWRTLATTRARNYYRKRKGTPSQDFSSRRAEASKRYRERIRIEEKSRNFGNYHYKDRTDEFSVKSFVRGMMLANVPPLPDLRPDQIAMIRVLQSDEWWENKANSNYPYLPPAA